MKPSEGARDDSGLCAAGSAASQRLGVLVCRLFADKYSLARYISRCYFTRVEDQQLSRWLARR